MCLKENKLTCVQTEIKRSLFLYNTICLDIISRLRYVLYLYLLIYTQSDIGPDISGTFNFKFFECIYLGITNILCRYCLLLGFFVVKLIGSIIK